MEGEDLDQPGGDRSYRIRSVERTLEILELLSSTDEPVTLHDVSSHTGLARSSAFRYLSTLEGRGYAVRTAEGVHYRLGPAFPSSTDRRVEALIDAFRSRLAALVAKCGETANLGILSGYRVRYLFIEESPRQVRLSARPGDRDFVHCTAIGKVIASALAGRELRRILEVEGLPQRTSRTITDVDQLMKELEEVRARGYAIDDRENEVDGRCVAVRVPSEDVRAAVSLSAPAARVSLKSLKDMAADLQAVVQGVSESMRDTA